MSKHAMLIIVLILAVIIAFGLRETFSSQIPRPQGPQPRFRDQRTFQPALPPLDYVGTSNTDWYPLASWGTEYPGTNCYKYASEKCKNVTSMNDHDRCVAEAYQGCSSLHGNK